MNQELWVFAEQKNGELREASTEAISEGRRLADQLNGKVCVVMMGCQLEDIAGTLGCYGVDKVYLVEDESTDICQIEAYTDVLSGLVRKHDPAIVLFAATSTGEDLASRVAARIRAGLTSGCDKLHLDADGVLHQTYLCYKDQVHMTVAYPTSRPQMATVRPGAMKVKKTENSTGPAIERVEHGLYVTTGTCRTRVLGVIKADPKTIDISEAELIVAGGKGIRNGDGFQAISELADLLGASVAGSRMAVDAGCLGRERQIGQSGKTVSPELMISCGISGASAHTIGLRDTRTIIAINTDRNAPMVKIADLGVIGDFHEVAPALIRQLKPLVAAAQGNTGSDNEP